MKGKSNGTTPVSESGMVEADLGSSHEHGPGASAELGIGVRQRP